MTITFITKSIIKNHSLTSTCSYCSKWQSVTNKEKSVADTVAVLLLIVLCICCIYNVTFIFIPEEIIFISDKLISAFIIKCFQRHIFVLDFWCVIPFNCRIICTCRCLIWRHADSATWPLIFWREGKNIKLFPHAKDSSALYESMKLLHKQKREFPGTSQRRVNSN